MHHSLLQPDARNTSSCEETALKVLPVAFCILHAEPELTARPWFRVLNSYQEQSAYTGLVAELVVVVVVV